MMLTLTTNEIIDRINAHECFEATVDHGGFSISIRDYAPFQGASGLIIDFGTSKSAKIESLPSAVYSFGRHGSLSSRLRRKLRILLRHLAPVCLYGVKI